MRCFQKSFESEFYLIICTQHTNLGIHLLIYTPAHYITAHRPQSETSRKASYEDSLRWPRHCGEMSARLCICSTSVVNSPPSTSLSTSSTVSVLTHTPWSLRAAQSSALLLQPSPSVLLLLLGGLLSSSGADFNLPAAAMSQGLHLATRLGELIYLLAI